MMLHGVGSLVTWRTTKLPMISIAIQRELEGPTSILQDILPSSCALYTTGVQDNEFEEDPEIDNDRSIRSHHSSKHARDNKMHELQSKLIVMGIKSYARGSSGARARMPHRARGAAHGRGHRVACQSMMTRNTSFDFDEQEDNLGSGRLLAASTNKRIQGCYSDDAQPTRSKKTAPAQEAKYNAEVPEVQERSFDLALKGVAFNCAYPPTIDRVVVMLPCGRCETRICGKVPEASSISYRVEVDLVM
ncbi:hypothetical protein GGX14DRAFT_394260 [Mycena pura]|uniref:Uncharacterized protein n=1 Tax=Mycena pura TaxID=153505 RepID=A0AAD6VHA0_9AGAR|nr:hypothetical protein GGX14DRAFT_394260 [Mycena pura]